MKQPRQEIKLSRLLQGPESQLTQEMARKTIRALFTNFTLGPPPENTDRQVVNTSLQTEGICLCSRRKTMPLNVLKSRVGVEQVGKQYSKWKGIQN